MGAALHHYFTKSAADFEAKKRRGSGNGRRKDQDAWQVTHQQCTAACKAAVELGKALGRRYSLTHNVPGHCLAGGQSQPPPEPGDQQQR